MAGVRHSFGAFTKGIACGLAIRHDHGRQYMSDMFQRELAFLGMESSPVFVRTPEGNGCAERCILYLLISWFFLGASPEKLLWVRTFAEVLELCCALLTFRETTNATWLIGPARMTQDGRRKTALIY
jgi:transposase InsO family protein